MMKQTPRSRSYKDERDEMIDRETNGAALDAIITGAEVLAIVCWRRKNPAWKGALALLFFALAGKFWPMGEAYEEKAYRKAGLTLGGIGVLLMAACGRAMKRREEK